MVDKPKYQGRLMSIGQSLTAEEVNKLSKCMKAYFDSLEPELDDDTLILVPRALLEFIYENLSCYDDQGQVSASWKSDELINACNQIKQLLDEE